jgi:acetolactate synthase-1/3 small subunit
MMMIKISATGKARDEVKRLTDIFRGKVIDVTNKSYIVELTGDSSKLDAFVDAIGNDNIVEVVRTGVSGISRGERALKV